MAEKTLNQILTELTLREDEQLRALTGKGIFFIPELAFAYLCGKALFSKNEISKEYIWVRERTYPEYGIADLVLEPIDQSVHKEIVLEFKMDVAIDSYISDIIKLQRLSESYHRYLIALKFLFSEQIEDYKESLRSKVILEWSATIVAQKEFQTIHPAYATPGVGLLNIIKVN
ncbi:hypothetical protein GYB22_03380 [bacterium]|nr:hypothetical protein [bacterium]